MVSRDKGFHDVVEDTFGKEGPTVTPRREADRLRSAMMREAAQWRFGDSVFVFIVLVFMIAAGVGFWVGVDRVLELLR